MKSLLFCCAFLLSLTASPAQAQTRPRPATEHEHPVPQSDAELHRLARQQTATLADLLLLNQTQARYLQGALYEKLWQLQGQEQALPLGQPVPAATATTLLRRYYGRLLPVLSPAQYSTLLRLDDAAVAPFAPIVAAYRYVPNVRLIHRP